jgi:CheY-like chemotaxis protein
MMERQLHQLVRLIDDLLDVSRITRGRVQLRPEPCELGAILSQALESSRPLIEEAGVALTVSLPRQPLEIEADPARLSQVFSNLLTNAAKYTERGGRVSLSAERQGTDVVIKVRDTGIGIPPEMLARVFDMFTQVDASLERSHGGLGIGLSLVRGLVELHEGSVTAHSRGLEQGSEFEVRLPIKTGRQPPKVTRQSPPSAQPTTATQRRRILVVDDNQDAANVLSMMLRLMGHETRIAHDGLAAVEQAQNFRPQLVLLDLGMPKLNGYEAAQRIRQQPWGEEMVLVAVTGWGQEDDRRRVHEAGFDHHLVKPADVAALQALVKNLDHGAVSR